MKKHLPKIIAFMFLCSFATFTSHAEPIFFDGFDQGGSDSAWSADNGLWQIGLPSNTPDDCYEGEQCSGTILDANYPDRVDSRFISPSIILPEISGDQEIILRFWHTFFYNSEARGGVQISVYDENSEVWSDWQNVGGE